jgi:NADH-quinone oxidoreductase subunit A
VLCESAEFDSIGWSLAKTFTSDVTATSDVGHWGPTSEWRERGEGPPRPMIDNWLLILLLIVMAVGFGGVSVLLGRLLGPRNPSPEKSAPYECGMPAVGDARERQSIRFYLIAMIFLLFDIEVAFLYPWALALRALGWAGYGQVVLFTLVLMAGYIYVWKKGALEWSQS